MTRINVFRGVGTVLAAVLVAGLSGVPAQAAAAPAAAPATLSKLTYVTAVTAYDNQVDKSKTVLCPVGQRIVGGSAIIASDPGVFANLNGQFVGVNFENKGSYLAGATADENSAGTTGRWSISVEAVCADPPPGYEIITNSTDLPDTSDSPKQLVTRCSPGKKLLGGFGTVQDGGGQVVLDDQLPSADLTSVTNKAYEDETGFAGIWYLFGAAICADPIQGLSLTPGSSAMDSQPKATYTQVFCPTGQRALSVGTAINSGLGQVGQVATFVSSNHVLFLSLEDRNGFAGSWSRTAYAICAT